MHGSVELGFEVLVDRVGDVLLQRIGRIAAERRRCRLCTPDGPLTAQLLHLGSGFASSIAHPG